MERLAFHLASHDRRRGLNHDVRQWFRLRQGRRQRGHFLLRVRPREHQSREQGHIQQNGNFHHCFHYPLLRANF